MDPAVRFFQAARKRNEDPETFRDATRDVFPMIAESVRASCRTKSTLLAASNMTSDDVVQQVLSRLLTRPPIRLSAQRPRAALLAWARVVARNALLDATRKRKHEAPAVDEEQAIGASADLEDRIDLERVFEALDECAKELTPRGAQILRLLVEGTPPSGLELAAALGLLTDELAEAARSSAALSPSSSASRELTRAQNAAWQVVSRTRRKLARCLQRQDLLLFLPETLRRLERRLRDQMEVAND